MVIRPSYVLGGRAMEVVWQMADLERYMRDAVVVSGNNPVLIDRFIENAVEVDVDALCGTAARSLSQGLWNILKKRAFILVTAPVPCRRSICLNRYFLAFRAQTEKLAHALDVVGLMNVQFAVKDEIVYLLEVKPARQPYRAVCCQSPLRATRSPKSPHR